MSVRVRFAPSPTGYLHLGGLRTCLYNFLFVKKNKGQFILRIEDTDQTRVVPSAASQLEKTLKWLHIQPDESPSVGGSYGSYIQSERKDLYKEKSDHLVNLGLAYRCFCTEKRLRLLRKEALRIRQLPRYDNRCRVLTESEIEENLKKKLPYVIRFKLDEGPLSFNDIVYGAITLNISEFEGDPVILKGDGYPTYHFANVVDDNAMRITHVLRGVEWQGSTPKHLMLYKAFNWSPPLFAHLPLIMGVGRRKLSKRNAAVDVQYYRKQGYFPGSILNYLKDIGGGFPQDEIRDKLLTMEELIEKFDLEKVNTESCCFEPEKLDTYNSRYFDLLKSGQNLENLVSYARSAIREKYNLSAINAPSDEYIMQLLHWNKEVRSLTDLLSPMLSFLWMSPDVNELPDLEADKVYLIEAVAASINPISSSNFNTDNLNNILKFICKEHRMKTKVFMHVLRQCLTGHEDGPAVAEVMIYLGKNITIERFKAVLQNQKIKSIS